MAYTIEVLPTLSVVCLTFSHQVMPVERASALEDLLRRREVVEARSVMVDMAQATVLQPSHAEPFEYATRIAREPVQRRVQLAYVGDLLAASAIESLAAYRGDEYRRFRTRRAALRWIAAH
jgi:hypothetical protein